MGKSERSGAQGHTLTRQKLIAFGFSFSICYGTSVGLGRHQNDVKSQWEHPLKKSEYAFSVLYVGIRCLTSRNPLIRGRTLP